MMTDGEKLNDLVELVTNVRDLQKTYFQSRDQRVLRNAQKKEAELDGWLYQHKNPHIRKQAKIF